MRPSPLFSAEALRTATGVVLLDARAGADAPRRFEDERLEGAWRVDLDTDLAAPVIDPAFGGRHPLPSPEDFAAKLGAWGITPASTVVVYDDKGGANAAARAWWMLRALGHSDVFVLDGGLEAARAAGVPQARGPEHRPVRALSYPAAGGWRWPTVDFDEVVRASGDPGRIVLDARDPSRYAGLADPFDPRPGHIPGALSAPFAEHLDAQGRFVSPAALAALYGPRLGARDGSRVIATCGSGVTACHVLLALETLGVEGAALYVGSFGEWTRRGAPVEVGAPGPDAKTTVA